MGRDGGDMLEQLEGPVCSHHSSSGESLEAELNIPAAANGVISLTCQSWAQGSRYLAALMEELGRP